MYLEADVQPRFCDTDAAGHINNTAVAEWLEVGRMQFMMALFEKPVPTMLRRIEIDYDRELTHRAPAIVRTGVEKISTRTITVRQEIWQRGICCARAFAVDCYFDRATRQAAPIPEDLLAIYRAHWYADDTDTANRISTT
jgi:acyl-CoA thioester hydrolase